MSDTTNMKKITPIGSCRITQPLRRAQSEFGFELNKSGVYGYCHSSSEAVQMARFLLADQKIPKQLWPLLTKAEQAPDAHKVSDAYVVELSSAKSITIDGHSVQLNYLTSRHPEVFADDNIARDFWSVVDTNKQALIAGFLAERHCTDIDLLSRVRRKFTTKDDLRHDMAELMSLLPEVLFVTHIDALQSDGDCIASRSDFIKDVEAVARDLGAAIYNPTQAMRFVGQSNSIAKGDLGLAHYDEWFEDLVAQDLGQALIGMTATDHITFDAQRDPSSMIFAIASMRRSKVQLTTDCLTQMLETAPKFAAPALLEHAKDHDVSMTVLQALDLHLSATEKFQLWAMHGIGKPDKSTALSDRQIAEVIDLIRSPNRSEKLDSLLLQIGRPITPMLARALDRFLKFDFRSQPDLLIAAKVILKHAPSHTQAKGALYHVKTWLNAQNYASATRKELSEWADLNAQLPTPNISVDLKIARQHFASGDAGAAIIIGLRAQELAPDNLTLAVMLMRAAQQSDDPRQEEFAGNVQRLADKGSKYQKEANLILEPQSVRA